MVVDCSYKRKSAVKVIKEDAKMSKGLFGDMFDFNGDGDLNFVERAAEFTFVQHLMEEDEEDEEYTEDSDEYEFD